MNNYPPGVTGNEFAIAGPDYEREVDGACVKCGDEALMEQGYRTDRWTVCNSCGNTVDLPAERDPRDERYGACL